MRAGLEDTSGIRLYESSVEEITQAYDTLGHTLGWSFLYGPARTLSRHAPLQFSGLNPGGDIYRPPHPSLEAGNAYRVQPWGETGSLNPLQQQVMTLYDLLAQKAGWSRDELMDATLAANFCPFRSPSWEALPNKEASIAFSSRLWKSIYQQVMPPAIICLSDLPYRYFRSILLSMGFKEVESFSAPIGWGSVTYAQSHFRVGDKETLMLRLPHLSRFKVIGKQTCAPAVEAFTDAIATRIPSPARSG